MSHPTLSRRTWMKALACGTAAAAVAARPGLLLASQEAPRAAAEAPLYCVPVLGDLHFDRMEHHDLEWVRREKPNDERQIVGYCEVTEKYTPALLKQVAAAIKAAPAAVPFVVQVGDLVEGLCGSKALAETHMRYATGAIDAAGFGVPTLVTKGNHDITGPGAPEVYDEVLVPWLAERSGRDVKASQYAMPHGDDLFVFFDCYKPDLAWLETTLASAKARRVFFVVHQPVVPFNARADWITFGREPEAPQREQLLALLGKYRAIVLTGHLHKYALLTRATLALPVTQLAVCSVARRLPEKTKEEREGKAAYGPALLDLEPKFNPATLERRRALLAGEAPSVTAFEHADAPGFAMLRVYNDRVEADAYLAGHDGVWRSRPVV